MYHHKYRPYQSTFKHVRLTPYFDSFGELLEVLITIDALVVGNTKIPTDWAAYKKMMQLVRADPGRFDTTEAHVKQVRKGLGVRG